MKKIKLIILIFTTACFLYVSGCETNDNPVNPISNLKPSSKILFELFTNTSCNPCAAAGFLFDQIDSIKGKTINDTAVIIMRIHTDLFANDPFFDFNSNVYFARKNVYAPLYYNPVGVVSGTKLGTYNENTWISGINQKLSQKNQFGIAISNTFDAGTRSGNITAVIGQISGSQQDSLLMHVALTEGKMFYAGSNGETLHENILIDLVTPLTGESISISPGTSSTFIKSYTLKTPSSVVPVDPDNLQIVVFIQKSSTREVLCVEKKNLK